MELPNGELKLQTFPGRSIKLFFDNIEWVLALFSGVNIEELCDAANRGRIDPNYIRRLSSGRRGGFLMRQQFVLGIFPQRSDLSHEITDDNCFLIKISARRKFWNALACRQSPLLPIAFSEDISTVTKEPV